MSVLVAVDAGGSKTDAVVLDEQGALLGHARGPGASPQVLGLEEAVARVTAAVSDALTAAGLDASAPTLARLCISGLDLELELERYAVAIAAEAWTPVDTVADNDLFALLRAGTDSPDAAVVVCGTGINALAIRADGETARFPALGTISGDWGGGSGLGSAALWHAARARDGRGPATVLTDRIPALLGRATLLDVITGLHFHDLPWLELSRIPPVLLEASRDGDPVARALIDRQADEIVTLAATALERLGLQDAAVPVVLGGGLIRSGDPVLLGGIRDRLAERAPNAWAEAVDAPPIVGAGLLALDAAGVSDEAYARARAALQRV